MSVIRPDFSIKPHRIPISGATPSDIIHVASRVELIFDLAMSALQGTLENLRENLPSGAVDFYEVYLIMEDLRGDIIGRLEALEDRQ